MMKDNYLSCLTPSLPACLFNHQHTLSPRRPLPVTHYAVSVLDGPTNQSVDIWKQCTCPVSDGIFHLGGHFRIHRTRDIPVFLKRPQSDGKHLLRYVWYFPPQLLKTHSIIPRLIESVYNQQRPFIAKPRQDITYRTVGKQCTFYHRSIHNHPNSMLTLQR